MELINNFRFLLPTLWCFSSYTLRYGVVFSAESLFFYMVAGTYIKTYLFIE